MDVEHYQPAGQPDTRKALQYSQAVRAGGIVFVSGQPGWDANMKIPESYEDECRQVFENIRSVLAEAGCGLADVVEGISEPWPAWTMIANAGLGLPGMHVEVKVTAAVPG
jgi:enamine deaminase RidA (YjgF/YER057c/UK114 family)